MEKFATAQAVRLNAEHHGVTLEVPKDEDVIVARPGYKVTAELEQGLRDHKEELMRDLLREQAMRYLSHNYVKGTDHSVFDEPSKRLNEATANGVPMDEYRAAIREYVMAGVEEYKRVRRERS